MQPFMAFKYYALLLNRYLTDFFRWVYDQLNMRMLLQSYITLSLFGLIPGGWAVLAPIVALYAFTRVKLYQSLNRGALRPLFYKSTLTFQLLKRVKKLPAKTIEYIRDNPWQSAKFILAVCIQFNYIMPFSFLSIYAMYRFDKSTWFQTLRDSLANTYQFIKDYIAVPVHNSSTTNQKYVIYGISGIALAGITALIATHLTIFELILIGGGAIVGTTAIANDLWEKIKTPIKTVIENPGKVYGLYWGYQLAFFLFSGRIVGTMGPAVGHVEQSSIFSALFGTIIPSENPWFVFGASSGGLLGALSRKIYSAIHNISSSIFFGYSGKLSGEFSGVIGPTSFQIYLGMLIGYAVGCMLEQMTHNILEGIRYDKNVIRSTTPAQAGIRKINSFSEFLYDHRWNIAFISVVTPMIMASPAGAALAAMTYDSHALAALLASTAGLTAFIGTDYVFQAVRRNFFPRRQGRVNEPNHSNVSEQPEATVLPAPAVVEPALVVSPTVLNLSTRRNKPRKHNLSDILEAPAQPSRRSARLASAR